MYIIAVVGNCGLIYIISHEEAMHLPMYYFLALLPLIDMSECTSFVPNMLCIFQSASKRLTLMPDLCRCFSSTCWQAWSLLCSCLWLWITMWPFALPSTLFYHPHQHHNYQGWPCHLDLKCVDGDTVHFPDQASSLLQGQTLVNIPLWPYVSDQIILWQYQD